ncbi:MAG: hydantoinase B/oxoprolinase family protein [Actinobacteria bacterium]|nr:hydantoinase B/oxoprolinase family protein [Actinomycetota bacterium]
MAVDVIFGEIVREYFETVAREMNTTMDNTSLSPVFNEAHDCSAGLFFYDGKDVSLIARANAEPVHIYASVHSVEGLIRYYRNDLADGDVIMVSDPYFYGSHIPDWTVMKPVFWNNKPVFFPGIRAHMIEVGGPVAGGYNSDARDVWQEGFRLAPMKLYDRGELRRDLLDLLKANNRQPEIMEGDLNAMIGACRVAERRVIELLEKYGIEQTLEATNYILDYSERRLRAAISEWPDGDYHGQAILDYDFADTRDINVECTLRVRGDEVEADFTGSHPQTRGYVNSRPGNTGSWVYSMFSVVFDDIPINSGFFRPISLKLPEGSVVNPLPPAPVGNSTICIGNDVGQATIKALEKIVPERVGAATLDLVVDTYFGTDNRFPDNPFYVSVEYFATPISSGAAYGVDGWGAWSTPHCSLKLTTVEMQEIQYPVLYLQGEYAKDTMAPGRWRGTPAFQMQRRNPDGCTVIHCIFVQGCEHPLQGFAGGGSGDGNYCILDYGGPNERKVTDLAFLYPSQPGEVIFFQSGGGGAWGPALEREPVSVLADVVEELLSVENAREQYAVVIDPERLVVLEAETEALRAQRSGP